MHTCEEHLLKNGTENKTFENSNKKLYLYGF